MGLPDIESIPDTGAVFTIGRSRFADNFASHFFIRQDPVVTIVCGDEHSAVVCQSGRLFVFGSNDWGQLGLGHKNHVSKPSCVKILKPEKVTNVACGRAHTLICTGGEKIFACGSDQEGQLGRGGLAVGDSSSTPVLIHDCNESEGSRILQVAAGSHHSMALLNDGGVIAWGSNLEGQLGLPGTSGLVNKPTKVPIPEPVREISAGYYHTAFLTESGLIYVCGESESGKLGIVVNFSTQAAPRQLQLPDPAAKIVCGGHHSLVLTETGALYCFGSNVSGQLGMGVNVTEVQTPKLLPRGETEGEVIAKIATGESHTAVVTESGKLFICGDGRHGKLGLEENENNVHELTYAAKYEELVVTDVSCGGCHTILLGKRREENVNEESGSVNSEIGTKKSSLPPLKIPAALGRISGGAEMLGGDKNIIDGAIKSVETGVTEARDSVRDTLVEAKEKLESSVGGVVKNVGEKIDEVKKNAEDNVDALKKGGKESFEAVKKSAEDNIESLKKGAEDGIETMKKGAEENIDAVKKGAEESVEAVKKSAAGFMGGVKDAISGIKKPLFPKKVADYVEEGNKTEELLNDLDNETDENIGSKKNEIDEGLTEGEKSKIGNLGTEGRRSNDDDDDLEKKQNFMEIDEPDSDHQIPPPKPPRQKSGQEIHSKGEKTSSSSAKSSTSNGGNRVNREKSSIPGDEDEHKKIEGVGDKGDAKNCEGNQETETAQDDADVVHSPPPKTAGKMSKLFKGKKPQEEQNGVNGGGSATKSRVKSRTCALL